MIPLPHTTAVLSGRSSCAEDTPRWPVPNRRLLSTMGLVLLAFGSLAGCGSFEPLPAGSARAYDRGSSGCFNAINCQSHNNG